MRIKLDIPLYGYEIAKALGYETAKITKNIIGYITTDSRDARQGDLFIPLIGKSFDGESFISSASNKGALCLTTKVKKGHITIEDSVSALQGLATYYKTKLKSLKYTVAITGSVGKTTTKDFLKSIAEGKYETHATYKNYNNHLGVPFTILSAPKECEALILEMGMNHLGEISKLSRCAKPDFGVITKIGTAHIGNLGSRENIARAKLEITEGMSNPALIIPYGEPLLSTRYKTITFSAQDKRADIYIIYNEENRFLSINKSLTEISFEPLGTHMLECLSAAAGAAAFIGIDPSTIKHRISQISGKIPRQTPKPVDDFYILPDYYNASLESIEAALKLLASSGFSHRSALLGTVRELGEKSEEIHRLLGRLAAASGIRRLFLFGEFSDSMLEGALEEGMNPKDIYVNKNESDPKKTATQILENHAPGELILFKASNQTDLGRIADLLLDEKSKGDENSCS